MLHRFRRNIPQYAARSRKSSFSSLRCGGTAVVKHVEQGVALTGRDRTGPPCIAGRPTAHAPGPAAADLSRARRPVRPSASSVTDDDRRQTPANKTILAH